MASSPSSIKPLQSAKETILGLTVALEQRFGVIPRNDVSTTLNSKFGVFPTRSPVNPLYTQYFCYGIGGRLNDAGNLTSAQPVLGTNMAPYEMRPFRAVPLETPLDAETREKYALRQVRTINGIPHELWYLKKIEFPQTQVSYTRTDPVSGTVETYEIDYSNLSPVPPVADDNGIITDVADSISVVVPGILTLTGEEIMEAISVLDDGDMRNAVISEVGFVSASTENVTAADINGASFAYDEAIFAQMLNQYNWVGTAFVSSEDVWTRAMSFSMKNQINS
jgi:hypothetical protein